MLNTSCVAVLLPPITHLFLYPVCQAVKPLLPFAFAVRLFVRPLHGRRVDQSPFPQAVRPLNLAAAQSAQGDREVRQRAWQPMSQQSLALVCQDIGGGR